jgi:uncharacterized membrane protein YwzB
MKLANIAKIFIVSIFLLTPQMALALTAECPTGVNCSTNVELSSYIMRIVSALLSIALVVDVLFLIIGGFFYIISGGNEERAQKGKSTVVNAIIGLIIIMLSYVIAYAVSNLFLTI